MKSKHVILLTLCAFFIFVWLYLALTIPSNNYYLAGVYTKLQGNPQHILGLPALFEYPTRPMLIAICFAYMLITTAIGFFCLEELFVFGNSSLTPTKFLSGFMVGYVALTAINRVVTLVVVNKFAPKILSVLILILFFIFIYRSLKGWRGFNINKTPALLKCIFIFVGLVLFGCIWSVCFSGVHVTGDATEFTFRAIFNDKRYFGPDSLLSYFPKVTQHYDEIMYLYPILYGFEALHPHEILFAYWVMTGFSIASCFAMLSIATNFLGLDRKSSLIISGLCFAGLVYLQPYYSVLLFDSGNPILHTTHVGRLFSTICIVVFSSLAYTSINKLNQKYVVTPWQFLIYFALGIGISTFSLHVVFVLTLFIFLSTLLNIFYSKNRNLDAKLLPLIILLSPFVLYSKHTDNIAQGWVAILYVVSIFFYILKSNAPLLRFSCSEFKSKPFFTIRFLSTQYLFIFYFGVFIGCTFFGNLFYPTSVETISRNVVAGNAHIGIVSDSLHSVFLPASNPQMFIGTYGFPLLLAAISLVGVPFFFNSSIRIERLNILRNLLFTSLIGFFIGLVCFHFFSSGGAFLEIWVRSRMLESWFYSLIVLSYVYAWTAATYRIRCILFCVALLLAVTPSVLVLGESRSIIDQFLTNLAWLMKSAR